MTLTIEQKILAVAEAYTKRFKLRDHYAELADAGDEDARRKLQKIERRKGVGRAENLSVS